MPIAGCADVSGANTKGEGVGEMPTAEFSAAGAANVPSASASGDVNAADAVQADVVPADL